MVDDWPYDDHPAFSAAEPPSWECPGGICVCHPVEEQDLFEFSVMLCHPNGRRMPHARFRTTVRGAGARRQDAHADDQGWATIVTSRRVDSILLEWAPQDTPASPELPYRRRYFVELDCHDRDEAALRRLHNLGFSRTLSLRSNTRDFQHHYGLPATGELDHVEPVLEAFHDHATVPVVDGQATESDDAPSERAPAEAPTSISVPTPVPTSFFDGPAAQAFERAACAPHDSRGEPPFVLLDDFQDPAAPQGASGAGAPQPAPVPQPPPSPPVAKGHQRIGGGLVPGLGTAQQKKRSGPAPPPFITQPRLTVVVPRVQAFINAAGAPELKLGRAPNGPEVKITGTFRAGQARGFFFLRQIVEHSIVMMRAGSHFTLHIAEPGFDGRHVMGGNGATTTRKRVRVGQNTTVGTDRPGIALEASSVRPDERVTLFMRASFQTYLLWSPVDPTRPGPFSCPHWSVLAGKRWAFLALATGVAGSGSDPWKNPAEKFHTCRPNIPVPKQQSLTPADFPGCSIPAAQPKKHGHSGPLPVGKKTKTAFENGC